MFEVFLGVTMCSVVIVSLVAIILVAKSQLVQSGDVTITINNDPDKAITVPGGGKLLNVLAA
ncbi:MAG TPA: NADH:ubiquinone reductase (Na(+)-transporting) subunit F, partial [Candidatus Latescibacteria bacterium]|nr:NADH:ubiquinone reductase (Na(+)-transporting) subunit F [Candidatus Latescibacterota bacterium]